MIKVFLKNTNKDPENNAPKTRPPLKMGGGGGVTDPPDIIYKYNLEKSTCLQLKFSFPMLRNRVCALQPRLKATFVVLIHHSKLFQMQSGLLCRLFDLLYRLFGLLCRLFDLLCRLFGLLCRLVGLLCRLFGLLCRLFGLLYRLFGLLCRLFGLLCRLFDLLCRLVGLL